jgi:nitrogenase-stabilizing/protective protein
MIDPVAVPELAGLSEAEDFFEALRVGYDPRVLDAHRLHILRTFSLALGSWLGANPDADEDVRRFAAARALREAHGVFAEKEGGPRRRNPFAPGLVQLGRPRPQAG